MSGRRRNGLGRGLGALIGPPPTPVVTPPAPTPDTSPTVVGSSEPTVPSDTNPLVGVPGVRFLDLPIRSIRANPRQPRTVFDED